MVSCTCIVSIWVLLQSLPLTSCRSSRQPALSSRRVSGSSFGAPTFNFLHPTTDATYDYVVVGGGNAGLPIAVRLAEAGHSVALCEAGTFSTISNGNLSQVPFYQTAFSFPPNASDGAYIAAGVDWNFTTSPQFGGRAFAQGKALGGSTSRSHGVMGFGARGSYQRWADLVGDDSYRWENFSLYHYRQVNFAPPPSSRFTNSTPRYDKDLLQYQKGPLSYSFAPYAWPWSSWGKAALVQAGMQEREDGFTAGHLMGSGFTLQAITPDDSTTDSSQTSYLQRLGLQLPNLIVYPSTLATRILFESSNVAVGVEVDFHGTPLTLHARNETIISAGVIKSPQLLMVSGIGPRATLERNSIEVISDLAGVGQNLQDHVAFGAISRRVNVETTAQLMNSTKVQIAEEDYLSNPPTGPLTTFPTDLLGFEKLPGEFRDRLSEATKQGFSSLPEDWPELEYLVNSGYAGPITGFFGSPDGLDWASMLVALAAPFSRGNITIQSSAISEMPLINAGWLQDERDMDVAVQAFRRLQQIMNQTSIRPIFVGEDAFPAPELVKTDEQVRAIVKLSTASLYQMGCTCKMGQHNDPFAVLDSQARVYGTERLRVVDASSLPFLPPGHISGTVYALAEKIADDIISGR